MTATASRLAPLTAAWAGLALRERRMLILVAVVIALALLWWLALAPALRTLRVADTQRQALQAQAQHMQQLQAQAQSLKALPRLSHAQAQRALESAVQQWLGNTAQLNVTGPRASLTLRDTPAEALAQWLADARANARAMPIEAQLTRKPSAAASAPTWSGTLSLSLPE